MSMSLLQVFQQLYDMLREPKMECAHPHAHEIADVYRNDIELYNSKVREWTRAHGIHQ